MMIRRYSHAMYGSNRLKKYEKVSLTTSAVRGWSRGNIHVARVLGSYMVN